MNCQRSAVRSSRQPSFGVREGAVGMGLGLLLLGGAMTNLDFGFKWNFGDCHCAKEPTPIFASAASLPQPMSSSLTLPSSEEPLADAERSASPLPVAGEELQGAQPGAEPEARLALNAFPSAAPYQQEVAPAPAVAAPKADAAASAAFSQAPGLDAGEDELVPLRRRR